MRITLKARRIAGNDPVTFKNPYGEPIVLSDIGSTSDELPDDFALKLCALYSDILCVAGGEMKVSESPETKVVRAYRRKKAVEEPLTPIL